MKTNLKKFMILVLLSLLIVMPLVSALSVGDNVSSPAWLVKTIAFLNLGTTWAQVIAAICVFAIIVAALYDILSFTAFGNDYVKMIIAVAIGIITAISGGIMLMSAALLQLVGGATILGVVIAVIIAIFFFVIASFFTSKLKSAQARRAADDEYNKIVKKTGKLKGGVSVLASVARAAEEE